MDPRFSDIRFHVPENNGSTPRGNQPMDPDPWPHPTIKTSKTQWLIDALARDMDAGRPIMLTAPTGNAARLLRDRLAKHGIITTLVDSHEAIRKAIADRQIPVAASDTLRRSTRLA